MEQVTMLGNRQTISSVLRAIETDSLASCYIFEGPQGSGKRTLALYLSALLTCEHPKDGVPCFACRDCENVFSGAHPDVYTISPEEEKKEIGVDQIRAANNIGVNAPIHATHRVFLVPDAHKLNQSAQNALLKNLEEPRGKLVYFLLTSNTASLLPTVRSRAMKYRMEPLSEETLRASLSERFPKESAELIEQAAHFGSGCLGVAIEYLSNGRFPVLHEEARAYLKLVLQGADFPALCEKIPSTTKREELSLLLPVLLETVKEELLHLSLSEAQSGALATITKLTSLCELLCQLMDPAAQNVNLAASIFALHSLASQNIGGNAKNAHKDSNAIY